MRTFGLVACIPAGHPQGSCDEWDTVARCCDPCGRIRAGRRNIWFWTLGSSGLSVAGTERVDDAYGATRAHFWDQLRVSTNW